MSAGACTLPADVAAPAQGCVNMAPGGCRHHDDAEYEWSSLDPETRARYDAASLLLPPVDAADIPSWIRAPDYPPPATDLIAAFDSLGLDPAVPDEAARHDLLQKRALAEAYVEAYGGDHLRALDAFLKPESKPRRRAPKVSTDEKDRRVREYLAENRARESEISLLELARAVGLKNETGLYGVPAFEKWRQRRGNARRRRGPKPILLKDPTALRAHPADELLHRLRKEARLDPEGFRREMLRQLRRERSGPERAAICEALNDCLLVYDDPVTAALKNEEALLELIAGYLEERSAQQ